MTEAEVSSPLVGDSLVSPTLQPNSAEGGPPEWNGIAEEIHCPLCNYNLRGLIEPRCPECGYRFAWPDLLDPSRRLHPYLFEHHPDRNLWSFLRTFFNAILPRKFWSGVHPAQPRNVRRLILYNFVGLFALLISLAGIVTTTGYWLDRNTAAERTISQAYYRSPLGASALDRITRDYGSLDAYLDLHFPLSWNVLVSRALALSASPAWMALFFFTWPWLTFAVMQLFPVTMRRAKLQRSQVLRCVIYCCDLSFWVAALIWLQSPVLMTSLIRTGRYFPAWWIIPLTILLWILVYGYRLRIAYRRYLGFPHALVTVASTQFIVAFFLLDVRLLLIDT